VDSNNKSIDFWVQFGIDVPLDEIFQKATLTTPKAPRLPHPGEGAKAKQPESYKPPKGTITKPESLQPHYSDKPNMSKFKKILSHPELGPKLQGRIGYHPKTDTIHVLHPSAHKIISEHVSQQKEMAHG